MQPVLPSNLDRTSAQVLGFDAAAYLDGAASTLHQRLNIPQNFGSGDTFGSSLAKAPERKKARLLQIIAASAGAVALAGLGYLGIKKGVIKLPAACKDLAHKAGETLSGAWQKISKKFNIKK